MVTLSTPIKAAESENPPPTNGHAPTNGQASTAAPTTPTVSRLAIERRTSFSPEEEARFQELVAAGDRALESGRLNAAADAYENALEIKRDSRLYGRLGLVLSMFRQSPELDTQIAYALQRAVNDAAGISTTERKLFFDAYEQVRKRVCRLNIVTNNIDAIVTIGKHKPLRSEGSFWTFIPQGKIDVTATLTGHNDIKKIIDCIPGKELIADFNFLASGPDFVALPAPPPEKEVIIVHEHDNSDVPRRKATPRPYSLALAIVDQSMSHQEDPWGYPEPSTQTKATNRSKLRPSVGLGPTVVFGAASWVPAIGAMISADIRPHDRISIGLEGRAAWVPLGLGKRPIQAMTAGGILDVCLHSQYIFGCALGHLGVIRTQSTTEEYTGDTYVFFRPGAGARIGVSVPLWEPISLRIAADALALSSGTRIYAGPAIVSDIPAVMAGVNVGATWGF
jgi:hypothetical protein